MVTHTLSIHRASTGCYRTCSCGRTGRQAGGMTPAGAQAKGRMHLLATEKAGRNS